MARTCSGVRPALIRPGLPWRAGTRRSRRTISMRRSSASKRGISRRSSGEAASSSGAPWPLVGATTFGSAATHRLAMSGVSLVATYRSRVVDNAGTPLSCRGLSPASRHPQRPEPAARWIAVTPAFAGAGRHRDDQGAPMSVTEQLARSALRRSAVCKFRMIVCLTWKASCSARGIFL